MVLTHMKNGLQTRCNPLFMYAGQINPFYFIFFKDERQVAMALQRPKRLRKVNYPRFFCPLHA